jgi:hypothetical protein
MTNIRSRTRSTLTRLAVLALTTALAALVLAVPAQAATRYCGLTWGSLPKVHVAKDTDMINDVRSGRHACFDRLVVDLGGQDISFKSYDVRYVPVVRMDGSGDPLPVRGAADLQIILRAPAHDADYNPTFTPANRKEVVNVKGYRTFRQLAWGGTFEGYTTMALGVRARLPFRVVTLLGTPQSDHGPRLVIDVAHKW